MRSELYYTSKLIPGRKQSIFYRKLAVVAGTTAVGVVICGILFPIHEYQIISWLIHAIGYGLVFVALYVMTSFWYFKKEIVYFYNYLKRK